jgi:hypothetical protein
VGIVARGICAADRGVRTLAGFWAVLAFALAAPLAAHWCQTSATRDAAETARLNAASAAIFHWQEAGHFELTRTSSGATITLRVPAGEWSALSHQEKAAVYRLLRYIVWRGGRVDRCLIRDEGGALLATG